MKTNKDIIKGNGLIVKVRHSKKTEQSSYIFCDKIEYMHNRGIFQVKDINYKCKIFDHHLMFWNKGELVFKVWLRNNPKNKKYKNIVDAMEDVGLSLANQQWN